MAKIERSKYYGELQRMVDELYRDATLVSRLDVVIAAESANMPRDLMEIVELLPPGPYARRRLCEQLNSAINGHAWGLVYGTVF